VLFHSWLEDY